jgi:thymidylate kinase
LIFLPLEMVRRLKLGVLKMSKHNYVVFEGADGIGKTVLAKNFAKKFGYEFIFEPFGFDQTTQFLRSLALTKEIPKLAREYLLLANRSLGYEKVNKILSSGGKVVSDRSYISGAVYAYMEGFDFNVWEQMSHSLISSQIFNDSPFVIFCTNKQFNNKNNPDDRYDGKPEEFHRKVESTFRLAFAYFGLKVTEFEIDFDLQPEENLDRLCEVIDA